MIDKNKKTILNEGRQVGNPEAMKYGGFPKVSKPLSEAHKKKHEVYADEAEAALEDHPLHPETHKAVMKHIGHLLGKSNMDAEITKEDIPDMRAAVNAIHDSGHTKHPMLHYLDQKIEKFRQDEAEDSYQKDRRQGMHNPGYW